MYEATTITPSSNRGSSHRREGDRDFVRRRKLIAKKMGQTLRFRGWTR